MLAVPRRDQVDPIAHERFGRVWPGVDPLEPAAGDAGDGGRGDAGGPGGSYQPVPSPGYDVALDETSPPDGGSSRFTPGLISRPPRPAWVPPSGGSALAALNPGRRAVKALAVVAIVVVALAAFVAWRSRPRAEVVSPTTAPTIETTLAGRTAAPTGTPAPTGTLAPGAVDPLGAASPQASSASGSIVVAVTGRVRHPGLVDLAPGARVADAIAAAGGVLPKTDLSFVNLARKVSDGELIVIGVAPSPGQVVDQTGAASAPAAGGGVAAGGPVDINTASLVELETLPGIGPALAQRIVDYRTAHGGFRSFDELQDVPGIGPSKFAAIKSRVTT